MLPSPPAGAETGERQSYFVIVPAQVIRSADKHVHFIVSKEARVHIPNLRRCCLSSFSWQFSDGSTLIYTLYISNIASDHWISTMCH